MRTRIAGVALVCVLALVAATTAQERPRLDAVRLDPLTTILDAFSDHPVVALGEGAHGNMAGHALRLALLRHPRFATIVNDIVVESGSARDQASIDAYIRGDDVPETIVREALENSATATPVWDRPMFVEFFRAVRDLNAGLPPARRIRVLLGDPPIDWATVKTPADYRPWLMQRDSHPAALIQREVLARGRKALVVYGDGHFQARRERPGRSLVGILETSGVRVFVITSTYADLTKFQPNVASWQLPALAMVKGTPLGAIPYEAFFGPPPPVDFFRANPNIEDHYDALIALGTGASLRIAPAGYPRCADPDYIERRVGRMVATGMPPTVRDRLAQECAAAKPQGVAQEQPAPLPVDAAFEVTSVKRVTDPTAQVSARSSTNGRLSAVFTVRTLVQLAYGYPETLRDNQVVGGPSWVNTDLFEINATFEGPIAIAPNSPPVRLLAMERRLLADRFQLKVHQETRPLRVFDLVVSRDDGRLGPRLKRSDGSCAPSCGVKRSVAGGMSAKGIPLSRFALLISFLPDVQRIVRDRTGLTDAFDLDIDFARSETADPQEHPPLMTALKEQLGLELRATTAPANVIVIDHVEQPMPD